MKKETNKAITFILVGSLLGTFNGIGGGWASTITAIIGFILFFMGLNKLKVSLDEIGQGGVKLLTIAAILVIVGLVIDLIPLVGGIIAGIIYIVAFIIELLGFLKFKKSKTIGELGAKGVGLIIISMILLIVESVFGILPLPFIGIICSILSIVAMLLLLFGWIKVQEALVE